MGDPKNPTDIILFCLAVGDMFQEVENLSADTDAGPGWSMILDVDRARSSDLGWLAQWIGVRLLPSLSDAAQRARIKATDGFKRGSPDAIIGAARQFLTGPQTVILRERDAAACAAQPAYGLTVITYTSQTPNPALVQAAVRAQKPAGLVLNFEVVPGQDYLSLRNNTSDYNFMKAHYPNYESVRTAQPV